MKNNYKENILVFVKGFIMGIAEVVPGVSGSTLALVMKIYYDFISFLYQISNFFKEIVLFLTFRSNLKKVKEIFKEINLTFGIFLFLGMFLAILSFSNLMSYLLLDYREFVLAFFFGSRNFYNFFLCIITKPSFYNAGSSSIVFFSWWFCSNLCNGFTWN